jgi:hypothetical protein
LCAPRGCDHTRAGPREPEPSPDADGSTRDGLAARAAPGWSTRRHGRAVTYTVRTPSTTGGAPCAATPHRPHGHGPHAVGRPSKSGPSVARSRTPAHPPVAPPPAVCRPRSRTPSGRGQRPAPCSAGNGWPRTADTPPAAPRQTPVSRSLQREDGSGTGPAAAAGGSMPEPSGDVGCSSPTHQTVDADDREINGIVAQATCADGRTIYVFDTRTHRNVYEQLGEAVGGVYDEGKRMSRRALSGVDSRVRNELHIGAPADRVCAGRKTMRRAVSSRQLRPTDRRRELGRRVDQTSRRRPRATLSRHEQRP